MYLSEFGLSAHPFGIAPRLDFLYRSAAFEESMAHLVFGLDNSEAIVMITGAIGTGKTMAVQSFLAHLGDQYVTALITNTSVDGKELLKLVLEDLGVQAQPGADKSDLLIAFKNLMMVVGAQGKRIVIVIDEAQNLAREVLEEIRLLTNLGQGEGQPIQVVLVGQPELETSVRRPDLAQLKQRIRVHYKLTTLSRVELRQYVDHRMEVAGGTAGVFGDDALDRIFDLSGGVPRLVNTLCGDALLAAYVAGRRKVVGADVEDQLDSAVAIEPRPASADARVSSTPTSVADRQMAVRRNIASSTDSVAAVRSRRTTDSERSGKAGRGWALVAVGAVVVAVVVLSVSGALRQFWTRQTTTVATGQARAAAEQTEIPRQEQESGRGMSGAPAGEAFRVADVAADVAETNQSLQAAGAVPVVEKEQESPSAAELTTVDAPSAGGEPVAESGRMADAEEPVKPPHVEIGSGEFYIHVSSFRTMEHAAVVAEKFTAAGLLAVVRQQMVRDVSWQRVYLGPFGSHDDAVRLANSLRDEGTITYYKVIQMDADGGS